MPVSRQWWPTGVYLIKNKVNGKVYVGSASVNLDTRVRHHKNKLRQGKHNNYHLQQSWNKYGEQSFEFSVLIRCRSCWCLHYEQVFMDQFCSYDPKHGYNVNPIAGSNIGMKWGPEVRAKVSAAGKGRKFSDEHKRRISDALRGKKKSADHVKNSVKSKRIALLERKFG